MQDSHHFLVHFLYIYSYIIGHVAVHVAAKVRSVFTWGGKGVLDTDNRVSRYSSKELFVPPKRH